jgi:hypothetical protein
MKYAITACLCCLCFGAAAAVPGTDASRWATFKTSRSAKGLTEHQIDRNTITPEGPYKTFWTRLWNTRTKSPLAFGTNEQLFFWSQKFAVDCMNRKFGSDFLDSTEPGDINKKVSLQKVRWESLDKVPVVGRVICGDR